MTHWEEQAHNWIAWARTPGHDAYWSYRDAFFVLVPEPGRWWLDDYARYQVLRARYGRGWVDWPAPLARRDPRALAELDDAAAAELDYYRFEQYLFDRHYAEVRAQAAKSSKKSS